MFSASLMTSESARYCLGERTRPTQKLGEREMSLSHDGTRPYPTYVLGDTRLYAYIRSLWHGLNGCCETTQGCCETAARGNEHVAGRPK